MTIYELRARVQQAKRCVSGTFCADGTYTEQQHDRQDGLLYLTVAEAEELIVDFERMDVCVKGAARLLGMPPEIKR